ncbi:hypothetical protein KCU66_g54, partial [Aureobasidium melanogenum]
MFLMKTPSDTGPVLVSLVSAHLYFANKPQYIECSRSLSIWYGYEGMINLLRLSLQTSRKTLSYPLSHPTYYACRSHSYRMTRYATIISIKHAVHCYRQVTILSATRPTALLVTSSPPNFLLAWAGDLLYSTRPSFCYFYRRHSFDYNGLFVMAESKTSDLQQNNVTKLHSVLTSIIRKDIQVEQEELLQQIIQPLSGILLSCGLLDSFCNALASHSLSKTRKKSNQKRANARRLPAAKANNITSLHDTNKDGQLTQDLVSVQACDANTHPRLCDATEGSKADEFSKKSLSENPHLWSYARQEHIAMVKNDPGYFLTNIRPIDRELLEDSELVKLLKFRRGKKLSVETLFRYYEGASNLWYQARRRKRKSLLSTTKADITSRYYKLELYFQIEEILEELKTYGRSTPGVNFLTQAVRLWIDGIKESKDGGNFVTDSPQAYLKCLMRFLMRGEERRLLTSIVGLLSKLKE